MDVVVDINVVVGNVTVVAAEKYERSPDSDFHDSMIYLIYTFNYTAIIYLHNDVNIDINDKQFICKYQTRLLILDSGKYYIEIVSQRNSEKLRQILLRKNKTKKGVMYRTNQHIS